MLIDLSHEFTFRYDIFGFSGAYWSGTESKDLRLCGTLYDPFPEERGVMNSTINHQPIINYDQDKLGCRIQT